MPRKAIVKGRAPAIPAANDLRTAAEHSAEEEGEDKSSLASDTGSVDRSSKRRRKKSRKLMDEQSPVKKVRRKRKTAEIETIEVKEEEEDDDDGDLEEKQDDDDEESKPKRRKRRKLLFSANKATNRAKRNAKDDVPEDAPTDADDTTTHADVVESRSASPSRSVSHEEETDLGMNLPTTQRLRTYTSFQLMLDHVLRIFQRIDPEEYFTLPVTEGDAPGYSSTVTTPMDVRRMREKMDHGEYTDLDQFRQDAQLIVTNAKLYNDPATVHYIAASKFASAVEQTLSLSSLQYMGNAHPFMRGVTKEQLCGLNIRVGQYDSQGIADKRKATINAVRTSKACLVDNMTGEEVRAAAVKHSDKLMQSVPKTENMLAYLAAQPDGTTTLHVLTSSHVISQTEGNSQKAARIYDMMPRLKQGNPGLLQNTTKVDTAIPVTTLDYGPFASFAPTYSLDSSTLSLEERRMLNTTYGSLANAQYAQGLASFVEDIPSLSRHVDGLLDALTNGQHSKVNGDVVPTNEEDDAQKEDTSSTTKTPVDFATLRTLSNIGIDVAFLDDLEEKAEGAEKDVKVVSDPGLRLTENGMALSDLCAVQMRRLSQAPPFTVTHRETQQPSKNEKALASKIRASFVSLVSENGAMVNRDGRVDGQLDRMMHGEVHQ